MVFSHFSLAYYFPSMITAITICPPPTPHRNTPRSDAPATAQFCCHGNKTILPPSARGFRLSNMRLLCSESERVGTQLGAF